MFFTVRRRGWRERLASVLDEHGALAADGGDALPELALYT